MTPDEFRRAMEAEPFRPFVIPLRGGDSVAVWDRSQVGVGRSGGYFEAGKLPVVVMVEHDDGVISLVDLTDGVRHVFPPPGG